MHPDFPAPSQAEFRLPEYRYSFYSPEGRWLATNHAGKDHADALQRWLDLNAARPADSRLVKNGDVVLVVREDGIRQGTARAFRATLPRQGLQVSTL